MSTSPPFRSALITGASGFIGSALASRLVDLGVRVTGVATRPRNGLDPRIAWSYGDLADTHFVKDLLARSAPEVVFHLASHVTGTRDLAAVLPTFHSNLASTVNLLTHGQEMGLHRIILTGSLEEPTDKEAAEGLVLQSPYAASKWAAAGYAKLFHALYGTPVVIARLFMVYGPAQRDLTKLIPYVIRAFVAGEAPRLSSGKRPVDWIYVDDVVDAYLAMATAEGIEGSSLDVGSGTLVTIREVVERLRALTGTDVAPQWGALPDRPLERVCTADVQTTTRRTGWRPSVTLAEGLARTVAWYRDHC
jgi:nucleoside-diphosphate-sugar epimerase